MSMKGGVSGPGKKSEEGNLRIWERKAFLEGGEFSFNRYIAHILQGQPDALIQRLLRKYPEGLLDAMSSIELVNAARKLSQELQDPEHGAFAKLGSYPCGDGRYDWDDAAERADTHLLTCILVDEEMLSEIEGCVKKALVKKKNSQPDIPDMHELSEEPFMGIRYLTEDDLNAEPTLRPVLEHYFKSMFDHSGLYVHHALRADRLYLETALEHPEIHGSVESYLPDFLQKLDPSETLNAIDVTQVNNVTLPSTGKLRDQMDSAGAILLGIPSFRSPFEKQKSENMLADFQVLIQRFKEGGINIYEIRDAVLEIENPVIQEICFEVIKKAEQQKLLEPGRDLSRITLDLDASDLLRMPDLARKIEQLDKTLATQSVTLMENLQHLERGLKAPSAAPVQEKIENLVRSTAELRRVLEDFKASPSPEKYEEIIKLSEIMELQQKDATPKLKLYNHEVAQIEFKRQQALEFEQQQIALQMEQMKPSMQQNSGPGMMSGSGDSGGGFG